MKKGIEAVLEISILLLGIFAFAYILGDEFRLVSAYNNGGSLSANIGCVDISDCLIGEKCDTTTHKCVSNVECNLNTDCGANKQCLDNHCVDISSSESSDDIISTLEKSMGLITTLPLLTNQQKPTTNPSVTTSTVVTPEGTTVTNTQVDFGKNILSNGQNILINAGIAIGLYFAGKWAAQQLGYSDKSADGLGAALAWGYGLGAAAFFAGNSAGWGGIFASTATLGPVPWLAIIGAAIAALIWFASSDYSYDMVTFNCNSWQPATGGSDCEQCNKGQFPCTKYKCQSLGQSCELVNEGTDNELCVWNNRNDISAPIIRAWPGVLSEGYEYIPDDATLAPDTGVIIEYQGSDDGCAPPFTTLKYGVALDKPGQCKMDVIRTNDYESMSQTLSSGMFKYNHSLISYSGGINNSELGLSFANGGNYEVYVRCQSKNGYSNVGTFVFKYCVSDEPDTSAPAIIATDPINGYPVAYGQTDKDVNIYVDKPSECRWSHDDVDFDIMSETMTPCTTTMTYNANIVFKCSTTLTGLKDGVSNDFYIRCKSYPGEDEANRHKNVESYKYNLIGTRPLVLDWVLPNGTTIKDATTSVKVTLEAHTSAGYKEGEAQCYYKESSQSDANYVLFFNTDSFQHSQILWLAAGTYNYDIKCCDLGGNCDTIPTEFNVETDTSSPMIIRIYNENNKLKIVTNEKAECVYSTTDCNYLFDDGLKLTTSDNTEHLAEWNTASNLYIKCQDEFGNQPLPNECSIVVRPFTEYTTTSSTTD